MNDDCIHRAVRARAGKEVQTVLVIDDEPMTVEFLAKSMRNAGYRIVQALGGQEGINLAIRDRPDLVILDLLMPEVSGFEVVRQLRSQPQTRDLPIIIYTAKDLTDEERRGLTHQVQAIAPKSAREELLRELERLAHIHPARTE